MLNTVLLVDDSDLDLLFNSVIVERAGIAQDGLCCGSAREALDLLASPAGDVVDVILLDVNMPSMSGLDFLAEYEAMWTSGRRRAPVIMLTSSIDPEDRARATAHACVHDYLLKPLDIKSALALAARMAVAAEPPDETLETMR